MKHETRAREHLPSIEVVRNELAKAENIDDFFGRQGIFARLFVETMEAMLEAELSEELGYEKYEAKGRNSGNSRNGKRAKKLRTSSGEMTIDVPRDRKGVHQSKILEEGESRTSELEEKVLAMYGRGMSTRDIQSLLEESFGVVISPTTISAITDKVWPLVEAWQNRPLEAIYPIIYLDAIHVKLRRESKVENVAVYIVLGVDMEGRRDVLGHWVGTGGEGANFWLSVVTDLQNRGVEDVYIACVDGLNGFADAIHAVFAQTEIQRCILHQIRNSLRYVTWGDKKEFMGDLRQVYQAATREQAESQLLFIAEKWHDRYAIAIRSWEENWAELSTFFDYPSEIRRLIYTTNTIEGYNRQLRKVTKTKNSFPTPESLRKLLFLANRNITQKWTMPIANWANVLNQLAIRFEARFPIS